MFLMWKLQPSADRNLNPSVPVVFCFSAETTYRWPHSNRKAHDCSAMFALPFNRSHNITSIFRIIVYSYLAVNDPPMGKWLPVFHIPTARTITRHRSTLHCCTHLCYTTICALEYCYWLLFNHAHISLRFSSFYF